MWFAPEEEVAKPDVVMFWKISSMDSTKLMSNSSGSWVWFLLQIERNMEGEEVEEGVEEKVRVVERRMRRRKKR